MPTKLLDNWEGAAQREVERQAFINTSLRSREFYKIWNNKKEQHHNKQEKWKCGNFYPKSKQNPDTMDMDVTQLEEKVNNKKQ
jgi:hypothetical protein